MAEDKLFKEKRVRTRRDWDSLDWDQIGYGKHEYREIDPTTVNPDSFLNADERGEGLLHEGSVREYNCAKNSKAVGNDLNLDWISRVGTVFETDAAGYEGKWYVVGLPKVKAPLIYVVASRDPDGEKVEEIPAELLGITVNSENEFLQVMSRLLERGLVGRKQRERLTKHE